MLMTSTLLLARELMLYSLGHSDRSEADFLKILHAHGVVCLADVRAYPASRRHPQFSRPHLARKLEEAGINYLWLGDALGGLRKAAGTSAHTALAAPAMQAYADHMSSDAFKSGIDRLLAQARQAPTAMMCAERLPQQCHRSLIADYLATRAVEVIHLLDIGATEMHCLNPALRLAGDRLIYDRGTNLELSLNG